MYDEVSMFFPFHSKGLRSKNIGGRLSLGLEALPKKKFWDKELRICSSKAEFLFRLEKKYIFEIVGS